MSTLRRTSWRTRGLVLLLLAASVLLLPGAEAQDTGPVVPDEMLDRLSQGALIPYLKEHPAQAPDDLAERLQAAEQATTEVGAQQAPTPGIPPPGVGTRFNDDTQGLPQNEESVTRCVTGPTEVVLGGTNDYRGLFDTQGNFTGWHFSNDLDDSVENEGLLPSVRIGDRRIPSGGDPVVASDANCNLYAASLAYDPFAFRPSGIAVYRSDPDTLANCAGGSSPECWPTRKVVAKGARGHFLDKEWMHVGLNSSGATVVWTVYTDFGFNRQGEGTSAIKAVRCTANLARCSDPIAVSGAVSAFDRFVQFSDVTVADGRAFVTWTDIQLSFETGEATYTHKMKVTAPGSLNFGPTRTVAVEDMGLPPGGALNANDFRIATIPKNEVLEVNGGPKVFVVWDACAEIPPSFPFVCERPGIKLRSSDDLGQTWSSTTEVSQEGANYFPAIDGNEGGTRLKVAYFTSREDLRFDNRQDIELATINPATNQVVTRQDLTLESNESEADPLLGGFFIGDYIEVFAADTTTLVHYNANYVQTELVGEGLPIPQQDNFLIRTTP